MVTKDQRNVGAVLARDERGGVATWITDFHRSANRENQTVSVKRDLPTKTHDGARQREDGASDLDVPRRGDEGGCPVGE